MSEGQASLRLAFVGPADSVTMRRWVEWFAARGHETTVLTVEAAPASVAAGFRQIDLSVARGPRKLGRLISAARMALALRRLKPDVVQVLFVGGVAWGLPLAGVHPYAAMPWGSDVLEEQGAFREWYGKPLTRAVFRAADLVTVHSEFMERRVRPLLPPGKPLARIGRGVDVTLFRPGLATEALRRRWSIGPDCRVIVSPRLAKPFYRHERVIQALPSLCRRHPRCMLVLAEQFADRDYVEGLRRLAVELGVADRVRFVGAIAHEEMPLWLNLAEAVVMVPPSDGMPNTLLEAMACGTVPVLARLPQYEEVVRHGDNGFLVEPDPAALADTLGFVLAEPALRRCISEQNRRIILDRADQDREMAKMESWYRRLAAGLPRSRRTGPAARLSRDRCMERPVSGPPLS
jgi:glycosyltransferase involved in cell wall biosynthesis